MFGDAIKNPEDRIALSLIWLWAVLQFIKTGLSISSAADYFAWANAHAPSFESDLLSLAPLPLIAKWSAPIFDIPLIQTAAGILLRGITGTGLYLLVRDMAKCQKAAIAAVFLTALASPRIQTMSGYEILFPSAYLSFRQAATAAGVFGALALQRRRPALAGFLFGLAASVFNSQIGFTFALASSIVALAAGGTPRRKQMFSFLAPIIIYTAVLKWSRLNAACPDPLSGPLWWQLSLNTEPDDVSAWFELFQPWGRFLLLAAPALAVAPFIERRKPGLSILAAGAGLFLLSAMAESLYISLPAAVLDILVPLQLFRSKAFAAFGAILLLAQAYGAYGGRLVERLFPHWKPGKRFALLSLAWAPLLAWPFGLFSEGYDGASAEWGPVQYRDFDSRHMGSRKYRPDFLPPKKAVDLNRQANQDIAAGSTRAGVSGLIRALEAVQAAEQSDAPVLIAIDGIFDIGSWIRKNLPADAALIAPPYLRELKAASGRPVFLTEKIDGALACVNRCHAARYLERFHLLLGTDPIALPGIIYNGGSEMRRAYLSRTKEDFARIVSAYPKFRYILTEKSHSLDLPVAYSNGIYTLYRWPNL